MAQYTAIFTKPYADGYENLPSQNTPITASTLNDKDTAIEHIEDFLDGKEVLTTEEKTGLNDVVADVAWYEQNGFLSRNIFPLKADDVKATNSGATWTGDSCVINGVTYTVNSNADGYVTSITATGTASANANLFLSRTLTDALLNGNVLNGCPSGGGNSKYGIYCFTNSYAGIGIDYGTGITLTNAPSGSKNNMMFIQVSNGFEIPTGGLTFYPMIRIASVTDSSFTTYAPSNIELDNKKAEISSIGTDESGRTTASKAYAQGEHFYKDGKFCTAIASIASGATFTLNTNYVEGSIADAVRIKTATVADTTSANGSIVSTLPSSAKVMSAYCTNASSFYVVIPFINQYAPNYWSFHLREAEANFAVVSNTSVTIKVNYMD